MDRMNIKTAALWVGLMLAALTWWLATRGGLGHAAAWTAAVTALCATWWMFEAIPIPVTALVPLAVFPLVGVLGHREAASAYGDTIVLLFMGGFMLSKAAEHTGTHRRIAHGMLTLVGGTSGRRIVLGFMLATAVCSMWISNTATALMMLPVAIAVLEHDKSGALGVPLMLSIAYSASIGGMATPVGTPPNGVFMAVYETTTGQAIAFHQWMMLAGVVTVIMLALAWVVLTWRLPRGEAIDVPSTSKWTAAQKRTLVVLALAALAWITRGIPFGGWSQWFGITTAGDATVALLAVVFLFLIPSGEGKGQKLLDWPTAVQIPWGILLLFGGGIAIADAFTASGLSDEIGKQLGALADWPPIAIIAVACLTVTLLTEVTSNTATANVLLPVLAAAAVAAGLDPGMLMIPATLSASCAFMLPVATPPNAVVFGSGRVSIPQMARTGLVLNLLGVVVITLVCWCLLPVVVGSD